MTELASVSLPRWSAWASGLETAAQWSAWAVGSNPEIPNKNEVPEVRFLPASLRRRCSKVAKMQLYTSFAVLEPSQLGQVPTVFASQGGESDTTLALLEQIAQAELSSPMKFSLSVHNASAGLFSMAAKNKLPSTTISAGNKTFAAGLLEALTQLQSQQSNELLLVSGDELLPEALSNSLVEMKYHFASAFLFTKTGGEPSIRFDYLVGQSDNDPPCSETLPQPFEFIRWLLSNEPQLTLAGPGFQLRCSKEAEGFENTFRVLE